MLQGLEMREEITGKDNSDNIYTDSFTYTRMQEKDEKQKYMTSSPTPAQGVKGENVHRRL